MTFEDFFNIVRGDRPVNLHEPSEFDNGDYKLLLTIREARNGMVIEAKSNYGKILTEEDSLYIIPENSLFDSDMGKIVREIYNQRDVRKNSQTDSQE